MGSSEGIGSVAAVAADVVCALDSAGFSDVDERRLDLLDTDALLLFMLPKPLNSGTSASNFGLASFGASMVFESRVGVAVIGEAARMALEVGWLRGRLKGEGTACGLSGEMDRVARARSEGSVY